MRRNNNSSLLLTILGGAIFCFVFLGMAFIYTNGTKIMSGNNELPIVNNDNEEEIILGDQYTCGEWSLTTPSHSVGTAGSCTTTAPSTGTTWCKIVHTYTTSAECEDEGFPNTNTCYEVENYTRSCSWSCTYNSKDACETAHSGRTCVQNSHDCWEEGAYISCPSTIRVNETKTCTVHNGTMAGTATSSDVRFLQVRGGGTTSFTIVGVNSGTATVSANVNSSNLTSNQITVTSATNQIESISISGPDTITIGTAATSRTYTATVTPADADGSIVWSVSGTGSASISNSGDRTATLYATGAGTVTITAKSSTNSNVKATKTVTIKANSACTITAVNVSGYKHMSKSETETVRFDISGTGCGTEVTIRRNNFSGPTEGNGQMEEDYKPTTTCKSAYVYGCIKGTNICSNQINVQLRPDWKTRDVKNVKEADAVPKSAAEANQQGKDVYYTACVGLTNGVYTRCVQHYRGCSGAPSVSTSRCYIDDDGVYQWTANPQPTWVVVSGISSEKLCKEETDACYIDPNGEYQWGKYAKTDGYTLVPSVNSKTACAQAGVCYKNSDDDYKWAAEAPDACVKVESCWVKKSEEGTVPETCTYNTQEACEAVEGYKVVEGVDKPGDCGPNETEACYVRESDGTWVFGNYSKITGYYLLQYDDGTNVPREQCANTVPDVPKTSMDVTKVVYICMAVLMAAGVGFIYYSTVMKKQND